MNNLKRIPVLWFGTGSMTSELLPTMRKDCFEILAFIDERKALHGSIFAGARVIGLEDAQNYDVAYIFIGARPYSFIADKLQGIGIPRRKLISLDFETGVYDAAGQNIQLSFIKSFASYISKTELNKFIDIDLLKRSKWYKLTSSNFNIGNIPFNQNNQTSCSMKFISRGGYGDMLISSAFIKELYKYSDLNLHIDIFTNQPDAFYCHRYIRNIYKYDQNINMQNYDIEFSIHHFIIMLKCRVNLQHKKYALLREIVYKISDFAGKYIKISSKIPQYDGEWARFCVIMGWNCWDDLGASGAVPFSRKNRAFVHIPASAHQVLPLYGLEDARYLTLNASVGAGARHSILDSPKIWPVENWQKFCRVFKKHYPDIRLVQIGPAYSTAIEGVDLCLLGKTSMQETAVLLKHALLHVDGESGLVHLRRQLGGKSVVLFGPTPVDYYGYAENTNIVSKVCGNCLWLTDDWYMGCLKGCGKPACMQSIKPARVLRAVKAYLNDASSFCCAVSDVALYSSAARAEYENIFEDICLQCRLDKKPISEHIDGECGTYVHASKQWEYPYAIKKISGMGKARLKIADVGGGRGALSWYLARQGHEVTVYDIDFSDGAANAYDRDAGFIRFAAKVGFAAEYGSCFNLPAEDNSFEVVTCISVLEHVQHKRYALKELLRVLKPGGKLILTFDLTEHAEALEDDYRVGIFTPKRIEKFLRHAGIAMEGIYTAEALQCSFAEIRKDKVAGILDAMTVGGFVVTKGNPH